MTTVNAESYNYLARQLRIALDDAPGGEKAWVPMRRSLAIAILEHLEQAEFAVAQAAPCAGHGGCHAPLAQRAEAAEAKLAAVRTDIMTLCSLLGEVRHTQTVGEMQRIARVRTEIEARWKVKEVQP